MDEPAHPVRGPRHDQEEQPRFKQSARVDETGKRCRSRPGRGVFKQLVKAQSSDKDEQGDYKIHKSEHVEKFREVLLLLGNLGPTRGAVWEDRFFFGLGQNVFTCFADGL